MHIPFVFCGFACCYSQTSLSNSVSSISEALAPSAVPVVWLCSTILTRLLLFCVKILCVKSHVLIVFDFYKEQVMFVFNVQVTLYFTTTAYRESVQSQVLCVSLALLLLLSLLSFPSVLRLPCSRPVISCTYEGSSCSLLGLHTDFNSLDTSYSIGTERSLHQL